VSVIFVMCSKAEASGPGGGAAGALHQAPLSQRGIRFARRLAKAMALSDEDALVAGPMLRALQTAELWAGDSGCARFVHPLAGPRPYPLRFKLPPQAWDPPLEPKRMAAEFPAFLLPAGLPEHLWLQGIASMPGPLLAQHAATMLGWCRSLEKRRVFIVTDEGTISSYRQLFASSIREVSDMPEAMLEAGTGTFWALAGESDRSSPSAR